MNGCDSKFPVCAVTGGEHHHFFGYYDKCPWDYTGRYLLALETDLAARMPTPDDRATVGVVDLFEGNRWCPIGETTAWNWQQGCMLQWLGDGPTSEIIYNDRCDGDLVSVVQNTVTGKRRILPHAVSAVSRSGTHALCASFARLVDTRPGYGYVGAVDPWRGELSPDEDGIFLMDVVTGESRMVISLAQIAALRPEASMAGAKHWVNHLLFTPDGRRFLFLHRWIRCHEGRRPVGILDAPPPLVSALAGALRRARNATEGGPFGRIVFGALGFVWRRVRVAHSTRMLSASVQGTDVHCFRTTELVSHFDWMDSHAVLAYAGVPGVGQGYYLFEDESDAVRQVGEGVLSWDGHCSFSPDRRWLLVDSYPDDDKNMQRMSVFNLSRAALVEIGGFRSLPPFRGDLRCDLHPRWSRDGSRICFDSTHEGQRQVYIVDVRDAVSG